MEMLRPASDTTLLNELLDVDFALNAAKLGVWALNPVTNQVQWDARCRELFGLAAGNLMRYEQALKYIHPDDQARANEAFQVALNPLSGGQYDITFRTIGADDGTVRSVRFVGQGYFNAEGTLTRFGGIAQDVTVETRLRQVEASETRLRNLVNQAAVATAVFTGKNMTLELANEAILAIWGKDRSVIGKRLLEYLPELADQPFPALLDGVFSTGVMYQAQDAPIRVNRDGQLETRYVNFSYQALRDSEEVITGVLVMATDVTDKVRARQQIRESEERFENLVREASVGIIVLIGEAMRVEIVNETYARLINRSVSDLKGKPLFEVIPEAEADFRPLIDGVRNSGEPLYLYDVPYFVWVNGVKKEGFLNLVYQPYKEMDGRITGVIVLCQDVTQQVRIREEAQSTERRLRSIIAAAPAAIGLFVGRDLIVEMPNETFIEVVGKGRDIVGKPLREVMPELEDQRYLQILDEVYTTGVAFQNYASPVNIVRQGVMTYNYYNITYTPLLDAEGKVYAILDIAIDVTEAVKATAEREASEVRFRQIVEQAPMAIGLLRGREMVIEVGNEQIFEVWGKSRSVTGLKLLEALPEIEGQGFMELLQGVFETGVPYYGTGVLAKLVRKGKLEEVYFDFTYTPLRQADGEISGVMVLAVEVTEQVLARQKVNESEAKYRALSAELDEQVRQRTRQLEETVQDLRRSNESLQQFAYVASHDLQEPLRKIQSFGNLLRKYHAPALGAGTDHLERMQNAAQRMSTLIDDLLAYSRLSWRREEAVCVPLEAVLARVLSDLEVRLAETGAHIEVGALPVVTGEGSQLGQLFQNLLSNALKFHRAGVPPHVRITARVVASGQLPAGVSAARPAAEYHLIEVADNGIGFEPQYVDRVFQLFQRLHGRSEYSGTGIGLAICQKVATNHGGGITATSQPGHGTTFRLVLPKTNE